MAGLAYREFSAGPVSIAEDLAALLRRPLDTKGKLRLVVESAHTGQSHCIMVEPRASVRWFVDKALSVMGLSRDAEMGAYLPFRVKWVLVDVQSEDTWAQMDRSAQRRVKALVAGTNGPVVCRRDTDRVQKLGIADGAVFHLYAVEDEASPLVAACR